jgi:hypothetical protein
MIESTHKKLLVRDQKVIICIFFKFPRKALATRGKLWYYKKSGDQSLTRQRPPVKLLLEVSISAHTGTRRRNMRTTRYKELLTDGQKATTLVSHATEYYTPPKDPWYIRKRRVTAAMAAAKLFFDEIDLKQIEEEENPSEPRGDMITIHFGSNPSVEDDPYFI